MRGKLIMGGLLLAAVVTAGACTEPKVPVRIESSGPVLDSVTGGAVRTLTAIASDQNKKPMEGVTITWSIVDGSNGGTLSTATTTTGGNGTASVTFTAPAGAGTTKVAAAIPNLWGAVSYTIVVKP
jgi:hypothetical protein